MNRRNLKIARSLKSHRGWRWMRGAFRGTALRSVYLPHAKNAWKFNNKHLRRKK